MYEEFVQNRITQLRIAKNVSERSMSLDLGHSPGYIHSIASGRALPSMSEFFYICEYFGITPYEFFDEGNRNPVLLQSLINDLSELDMTQIENLRGIIKGLKK